MPSDSMPLYGVGSVSKVYTAAAAMSLVQEGRLDLDEPVVTYLPEFTMADARFRDITMRMLLNHSSGLMYAACATHSCSMTRRTARLWIRSLRS